MVDFSCCAKECTLRRLRNVKLLSILFTISTADGYCRATGGLGVLVVTYMVGGLSAINAVAGAYSDDLPLLLISGNTMHKIAFNDRAAIDHHQLTSLLSLPFYSQAARTPMTVTIVI